MSFLLVEVLQWAETKQSMDGAGEEGYKPPTEFREDSKDPLVELNLTDSTELWLIQWPVNQVGFAIPKTYYFWKRN